MKPIIKYCILGLAAVIQSVRVDAQLTPEIETDKDSYCTGDSVKIKNITTGNYQFTFFNFGDGTETYGNELVHIYLNEGSYSITAVMLFDDNTKSATATKTITVNAKPSVSIVNNVNVSQLEAVDSGSNDSFKWFYNNNEISNETLNNIYYIESGKYKVTATNTSGCSSSDSINVTTSSANNGSTNDSTAIVVVNNVITPGLRDGINDVLYINSVSDYDYPCIVKIFDKNGKQVYSNNNYTNASGFSGFDENGNELFAGTYYYIIKSEGRRGATGFVDILR